MIKKRVVNAAEAIELMEKAVLERGEDWTYPITGNACMYFYFDDYFHEGSEYPEKFHKEGIHNGQPGCLVGLALSYIGLTPEVAGYSNDASVQDLNDDQIVYSEEIDWVLGPDAVRALNTAQALQDVGKTWRDSVDAAYLAVKNTIELPE